MLRRVERSTYLLHDTSLSLGESNMPTRLVGDELDLNLATLAPWLVIIVVVVVGGSLTSSLDPTGFSTAVTQGVFIEAGW